MENELINNSTIFETEEDAENYAKELNLDDYEIRWSQAACGYYIFEF